MLKKKKVNVFLDIFKGLVLFKDTLLFSFYGWEGALLLKLLNYRLVKTARYVNSDQAFLLSTHVRGRRQVFPKLLQSQLCCAELCNG